MPPQPTAPVRLIMVTGDNNNKFYNMTPNGSTFDAEWGRVGVTSTTTTYPISKWNSQYNSKIKKGYKDITDLVKATTKKKSGYADIADKAIASVFDKLMSFAKTSVSDNYTISSDAVTSAQVKEAQALVDELTKLAKRGADNTKVNKYLTDLYTVIPRRMKNVRDHLLAAPVKTKDDLQFFRSIIDNEQKTLDVMAGQVQIHVDTDADDSVAAHTILDTLGITVHAVDDKDIKLIKKMMSSDALEFRTAFRVEHDKQRTRFVNHVVSVTDKTADAFWHGSRNENWISILQTGLKIRPSNAVLSGSMFGDGIYFADKYRKSAGYTSLSGSHWARGSSTTAFLAIMDVHLGKQLEVTRHNHDCYKYSKKVLADKGNYNSVFAKGGYDLINNEFIVYDDAQSTIKYLVEVGK